MNTKLAFMALAGVVPLTAGCGSSPKNLIVGKWEAGQAGIKVTAEFTRDGKVTVTMFGQPVHGTYKRNGGDELGGGTEYVLDLIARHRRAACQYSFLRHSD